MTSGVDTKIRCGYITAILRPGVGTLLMYQKYRHFANGSRCSGSSSLVALDDALSLIMYQNHSSHLRMADRVLHCAWVPRYYHDLTLGVETGVERRGRRYESTSRI